MIGKKQMRGLVTEREGVRSYVPLLSVVDLGASRGNTR